MLDVSVIHIIASVALVLFSILIALQVAPIMSWVERKQAALIQKRVGPNRVGIFQLRVFGLGQPLADTIKLLFKEDFYPKHVNRFFYTLAPIVPGVMGLAAICGIPWGSYVLVGEEKIALQAVRLNVGFLYFFAVSAIAVFGVALAGWSSNSKYTLLGGLRASAQMVSYEIAMGLSLIPIVIIYGSLDLQQVVHLQTTMGWGILWAPVSFCIFMITMFAETNRLPFDLAEGEAELVAGFLTEYGSMRWSLFFLGEYAMMFTLSALSATLFLGGYEIPFLSQDVLTTWLAPSFGAVLTSWLLFLIGFGVLFAKVAVMMFIFVQARFTLPRFRYDQLMRLGWVVLLPLAVINVAITAIVVGLIRIN